MSFGDIDWGATAAELAAKPKLFDDSLSADDLRELLIFAGLACALFSAMTATSSDPSSVVAAAQRVFVARARLGCQGDKLIREHPDVINAIVDALSQLADNGGQ